MNEIRLNGYTKTNVHKPEMQRKHEVVWGNCIKLGLIYWTQYNGSAWGFFLCYYLKQQALTWISIIKAWFLQSWVLSHFSLMPKFLCHKPANKSLVLSGNTDFLTLYSCLNWTQDSWCFCLSSNPSLASGALSDLAYRHCK